MYVCVCVSVHLLCQGYWWLTKDSAGADDDDFLPKTSNKSSSSSSKDEDLDDPLSESRRIMDKVGPVCQCVSVSVCVCVCVHHDAPPSSPDLHSILSCMRVHYMCVCVCHVCACVRCSTSERFGTWTQHTKYRKACGSQEVLN